MENIELIKQPSRNEERKLTESIESHHSDKMERDHLTGTSTRHSTENIIPEPKTIKKPLGQRIMAMIPPYQLTRTVVKASIAVLISLLFVFEEQCRKAIGPASILVPIGTLLNFPVRPLGVQIEASFQGLLGALIGSAWCFLGMYLAHIARDPSIPIPVQPNSSAVLAIFMLIGVFGLTYVRIKFAQANFGVIFASMIVAFCLTQASVTPGFQPVIVYMFLKPIAMAAAIGLVVDIFLWPDDSITQYMGVLSKSLKEYNAFFQEQTGAFLTNTTEENIIMTLPKLNARLHTTVLSLIDSKREVKREILFNRLSHKDISGLTRVIKTMRSPLHGIGLSLMTKTDRLTEINKPYFSSVADEEPSYHKRQFLSQLEESRKISQDLSDICVSTLNECNDRLMKFSGRPRSLKSTILWPFPRIFLSDYTTNKKSQNQEIGDESTRVLAERLNQAIAKFEQATKKSPFIFVEPNSNKFQDRFNSLLQVIYLFQYNLVEHANRISTLVTCLEEIETNRTSRKFWFPHLTIRKYFRSTGINPNMGGQVGSTTIGNGETEQTMENGTLNLTETLTRPDMFNSREEDIQLSGLRTRQGIMFSRDPDINPPVTAFERFFYKVHIYTKWMKSDDSMFALKTAGGFVLLSLPAFLPQSAGWFFDWRGQWATVTLMMWMFPMAGMFTLTIILRVAGTALGGVLGIIVWKIVDGNPYGLVALTFVVICYEYQYVVSGAPTYDSIEMVAGKRIFLVLIGVGASAILSMIPKPVTGRVELRKRISRTLGDMSKLYGILVGDILFAYEQKKEPTEGQRKAFRKLTLGIRRQIADEHTYVKLSKLEPPLRGKFPVEVYTRLVEKVDNMSDLLLGMAHASRSVDNSWKRNLAQVMQQQRVEYLASILSIMKLLSATLSSKVALPPYIMSPLRLREKFAEGLTRIIVEKPDGLDDDTFPGYCAYAVNSYQFSSELGEVLECVEELVGVEDPEQWLILHA
ncbi:hypothetical protein MFLAVUS_010003 [Mucor flavus]|uniref:ER transporter 6TM N-terminal domain-containing protein n=1 Tax=Mucor flavus TaxID=439312 RepID=A0ABP9ZBQ6_9FUNG